MGLVCVGPCCSPRRNEEMFRLWTGRIGGLRSYKILEESYWATSQRSDNKIYLKRYHINMNDITRKNFLKTTSLTFVSLFSSSVLANSSSVDFSKHNGNPVNFIENYFVIENYDEPGNTKHIKLRDY